MGFLLTLRQHLFLSVAVPLSLGMLICIIAAIVPLYSSINDWNSKTSDAIQNMNLAASTTRLSKLNEFLQVIYDQLEHDLTTMRNNTYAQLEHQQPISTYFRSYYGDPTNGPYVEPSFVYPAIEDTTFGTYQVFSAIWKRGTTAATYATMQATTPYFNETSITDAVSKAIFKANNGGAYSSAKNNFYFKIMHGFEDGFYRRYPYGAFPADYYTSTTYCADGSTGYDPRCRIWYTQCKDLYTAGNAKETSVVFSAPYIDAASKIPTISASSPLFDRLNGFGFIGVLNVDFNMQAIDNVVLTGVVSHTGYIFLMDKGGNIISHPRWDRTTTTLATATSLEPAFSEVWADLAARGEAYLTSNNQYLLSQFTQTSASAPTAYLLYVPASSGDYYIGITINPSTGYILVMMLPANDLADDNASALSDLKSNILTPGTAGICVVTVGLFVILLIGTHYIARYYSQALKDAAVILQQAVRPDLKVQLQMREPICYEINLLFQQFEPMFVAIRFGNDKFYEGNLNKALDDYNTAEAMMLRMNNMKGLAKVYNNKGNVYLKLNNFIEAENFYKKAVDMGRQLLTECEQKLANTNKRLNELVDQSHFNGGAPGGVGDIELGSMPASPKNGTLIQVAGKEGTKDDEHQEAILLQDTSEQGLLKLKKKYQHDRLMLLIQLGKRESNLGVLYKSQNRKAQAYKTLTEAMEHHQQADDDLGMARVSSNLAQFYIEDGKLSDAQSVIQSCYNKLSSIQDGHAPDPISLQYATMTLGLLCQKQEKLEDAAGWLQYTLQLQDRHNAIIDSAVQQTCFQKLEQIFRLLRNDVMASKYKKLNNHQTTLKNVLFALDCSGSMAGSSITRCRTSIKEIITSYIEPEDRVGLITFNSMPTTVFPLTERGTQEGTIKRFTHAVDTQTQPTGHTSLWDALYEGVREFGRVKEAAIKAHDTTEAQRNNWLIALTDGEDNASSYTPGHVQRLIKQHPLHFIIITVGQSYDKQHINDLVRTVKEMKQQAHHIQIGSDKISQAFESVAKMITAQLNVETI